MKFHVQIAYTHYFLCKGEKVAPSMLRWGVCSADFQPVPSMTRRTTVLYKYPKTKSAKILKTTKCGIVDQLLLHGDWLIIKL